MISVNEVLMPSVRQATEVLGRLEDTGLTEPVINSSFVRGVLVDLPTHDVDVAYVGSVDFTRARVSLTNVLANLGLEATAWDMCIWNAQLAHGVTSSEQYCLEHGITSVDSVYLASDGRLHDPTGHGFEDAKEGVLRFNEQVYAVQLSPAELVRACLEGCRRIIQYNWSPTPETRSKISEGVAFWDGLDQKSRDYLQRRFQAKYRDVDRERVKQVHEALGWGGLFSVLTSTIPT